jgi:hypothetical protein
MSRLRDVGLRPVSLVKSVRDLSAREKYLLLSEITKVRGLMPLLMKQRNNQRWTREDKAELATHLRRLAGLSPYLVVLLMPGGFLLLPALAWWLDRRRQRPCTVERPDA